MASLTDEGMFSSEESSRIRRLLLRWVLLNGSESSPSELTLAFERFRFCMDSVLESDLPDFFS